VRASNKLWFAQQQTSCQDAGIMSEIVCHVTPWYYKRMAMVAAMCAVFAGLFFKDGAVGYPAEAEAATAWETYKTEVLDGYDAAKTGGTLSDWAAQMKAKGYPLQESGEPVKWANYAAEKGWAEKPKMRTPAEIAEQFYWGYGMTAVVLFCGIHVLITRKKTLRAGEDHLTTPEGKVVRYADAYRIDKRKWDVKALAYVYYKEQGAGPERKATIDDLKYDGAGRVLDRLMEHFKGEIIEKVIEEEEEVETEEQPK
jgi:hypothetical protein